MFEDWENLSPIRFDLKVDNETRLERIKICESCENLTKLKTCQECGCFMPIKIWLKMSKCPLDKWPQ